MSLGRAATVILPLPLSEPFSYRIPENLSDRCCPGVRVEVPLGPRRLVGVVLTAGSDTAAESDKAIATVLDETPILPPDLLVLLRNVAATYHAPIGEALRAILPPGLLSAPRTQLSLTPAARTLLAGLPSPQTATLTTREKTSLLKRLAPIPTTGTLPCEAYRKKRPSVGEKGLAALEAAGWIERDQIKSATGTAMRSEAWVQATSQADSSFAQLTRAPRQLDCLKRLIETGDCRRKDFVHGDANLARALSELIKKGLVVETRRPAPRSPLEQHFLSEESPAPETLWPDQRQAAKALTAALATGEHAAFLLTGAPGSGKTEVYLQAAQAALDAGRGVLLLVPEIALTPQLASRVAGRFGSQVAIWHSGLAAGERLDEWRRILEGQANVVVGARSAIFAPVKNLGLVVVDEEQDSSYKSEDRLYYQARTVALMRTRRTGAVALFGSATPALESIQAVRDGHMQPLHITRPDAPPPPQVTIIDMGRTRTSRRSLLSAELSLAIGERLTRGEQSILLLNRRGFAPYVRCRHCKETLTCRQCSVSLAYHRTIGKLLCHHCGAQAAFPPHCPYCGRDELELTGVGTQRVEDELELSFPEARIARLDRDAIARRGSLAALLNRFARGELDILVGTQLVSKSHDFPNVTLVGVLNPDATLHMPDFRSAERAHQLLVQVTGRAGRRQLRGEVIVQTFQARHAVYRALKSGNAERFVNSELTMRSGLYPPFRALALLRMAARDEDRLMEAGAILAERLRRLAGSLKTADLAILGPAPAPIARLRGHYRARILLKAPNSEALEAFLHAAEARGALDPLAGVGHRLDIDPSNLM